MKNVKKYLILIVVAIILILSAVYIFSKEKEEPEEEQIKAICELATLDCYYNNVAKITKEKGSGLSHVLEKEREIWIEYEAIVKIGIDMKELSIKITDNKVEVSMPKAAIMDVLINKDTMNADSYIISEDGFFNKNKVTTEEQQDAIVKAQIQLEQKVNNNPILFEQAEKKAKSLIENYINTLGEMSGIEYIIEWKVK